MGRIVSPSMPVFQSGRSGGCAPPDYFTQWDIKVPKQLDFNLPNKVKNLTVYEAFDILWEVHLNGLPSGKSYQWNRKALCRSFGGKFLNEVTTFDFRNHRQSRLQGMNGHQRVSLGAVFHDHGLLHLLYNKFTEWKREGMRPLSLDLSNLQMPPHFPTEGSKRVKPPKRKVIATPEQFLSLCQNATDRLRRTIEALLDLDIRETDLKRLRPSNYNPYTDQVEWIQNKTGKENSIPITERVRQHFVDAKKMGREFVYDLTNSRKEFNEARALAGIPHITKRDIRKTAYNAALRFSKDYRIASMMAGHTSIRTGVDHYEIEFREDLKPVVKHLELTYRSN